MKLQLSIALLSFAALSHVSAHAQTPCTSNIASNVSTVSVTTGGVQSLTIQTNAPSRMFVVVGSFSSSPMYEPYFAYGGLYLPRDRYLVMSYLGRSPFLAGGFPNAPGGHQVFTDAQGVAFQDIVVPSAQFAHLVGRTVRHGVYSLDFDSLLPACGSNVVTLTLVP